MNKLLRTTGPITYRLVAVDDEGIEGPMFGRMWAGKTLRQDIADLRGAGMRPCFAVFVRPKPVIGAALPWGAQHDRRS